MQCLTCLTYIGQDEAGFLRRQRDKAQEEAAALRMQVTKLTARVDEMASAKVQLETQLLAFGQSTGPSAATSPQHHRCEFE